jgi:outer membrane lipoprotein
MLLRSNEPASPGRMRSAGPSNGHRHIMFYFLAVYSFLIALFISGCGGSQLVPSEMEADIARDVPFEVLKENSEKFKGRLVVLGGKVLSAKRLKTETRIEVLELLLDKSDRPVMDLNASKGRFLAIQQDFLDPATLPPGTLVSLIGEVSGTTTMALDEVQYDYLTVKLKTLKVWPPIQRYDYPVGGPWPYPYGPWPPYWRSPFWGPYPFWGPWPY